VPQLCVPNQTVPCIIYYKDFIEEALKDAPGGVHILLEGTTQDEIQLVALGYRYSQKAVLHFVLTKMTGNFKPGIPYQMKYTFFW
jgi:hypothetical protein